MYLNFLKLVVTKSRRIFIDDVGKEFAVKEQDLTRRMPERASKLEEAWWPRVTKKTARRAATLDSRALSDFRARRTDSA
jgi:hypothetical protein